MPGRQRMSIDALHRTGYLRFLGVDTIRNLGDAKMALPARSNFPGPASIAHDLSAIYIYIPRGGATSAIFCGHRARIFIKGLMLNA